MGLTIGASALAALHAHAQEGYPHEVVGILAGNRSTHHVTSAVPLQNEHADRPEDRYHVGGLVLMKAERSIEADGLEVVGYYHSHPDHPAIASETDRDNALPNMSYVITAVHRGAIVDTRSWRLRDDRTAMDEEPLHPEA